MRYSTVIPICALLGACVSPIGGIGGGLSDAIVEAYSGPSFDAQIVPGLRGTCNEGEIATLRQTHIEVTRATNNFDIQGVMNAGNRLYGVSPACRNAYQQTAAAICRQQAIDSWQPNSEPYETALARANNCG
ncbi:hypothetical protein [Salipiger sp. PrR002]|uniref:hypothetical protein n=1 Tax=Salipiger sp. PrR002 TaxID=2706489 RepID=UPI0013B8C272|nr:hypothetical protein [Salipiger sp. PrR002]NDW02020.1 hypothetical protein [Salipiger sp. PrR002]NDW59142.1 hypothetical protein [Salipiger sp. PrR004]